MKIYKVYANCCKVAPQNNFIECGIEKVIDDVLETHFYQDGIDISGIIDFESDNFDKIYNQINEKVCDRISQYVKTELSKNGGCVNCFDYCYVASNEWQTITRPNVCGSETELYQIVENVKEEFKGAIL